MRTAFAATVLLLTAMPGRAHRLDEYLQQILVSIGRERLEAEISLTPGVAVFPMVAAEIDADRDGVFSGSEQRAYAGRVLHDLSLTVDGHPLTPRLLTIRFPGIDEMKEGLGSIRIEFQADLPRRGGGRRLVIENRHQRKIGAYLVNCLVPRDPRIRVLAQSRNYSQSFYQLDYTQPGAPAGTLLAGFWADGRTWLGAVALLLFARFAFFWGRRIRYS